MDTTCSGEESASSQITICSLYHIISSSHCNLILKIHIYYSLKLYYRIINTKVSVRLSRQYSLEAFMAIILMHFLKLLNASFSIERFMYGINAMQ